MAMAVALLAVSACGQRPMTLSVRNVSDEDLDLESVGAPEFAYSPPTRMTVRGGKGNSNYHDAVRTVPTRIVVAVKGRPAETVSVAPLPRDIRGRIDLVLVYTRSRRWATRWEVRPENQEGAWIVRLIPDEDDPQFQLHAALLKAAESGGAPLVDELLRKGAPLRWDTTSDNPLVVAARWHNTGVVERLLQLGESAFTTGEIEDAVVGAAGECEDIRTLHFLISRFGAALSQEARARALKNAAESHRVNGEYRVGPSDAALRFLIDEANFDVNMPLSQVGHTVLDVASQAAYRLEDKQVLEFLKARGGKYGPGANDRRQ